MVDCHLLCSESAHVIVNPLEHINAGGKYHYRVVWKLVWYPTDWSVMAVLSVIEEGPVWTRRGGSLPPAIPIITVPNVTT